MDTTFYFDTNSYFNIVPNHFFRFLIKHLFTYENNHWCEEIVKRKLITWVCDEKGMEMFQRFNGTLKINFDNNFTIIIPNKALFTRKHEFIFASKDIPDDDYNEDAEGEEAVEEITPIIKEEYNNYHGTLMLKNTIFNHKKKEQKYNILCIVDN